MRTINSNIWKNISDIEYIAGLKSGNNHITESFFYGLCNYLLNDIRFSLMQNRVSYDELVSEMFAYLSSDGWHKLNTFAALNGCSLRSWMVRVAWRFFVKNREKMLGRIAVSVDQVQLGGKVDALDVEMAIDINSTFARMGNKRYVQVLKWMLVDGYEADEVAAILETTTSNVYNIKHRAIVQFVEVYNAGR